MKKTTQDEFITKIQEYYGDYDYDISNINYINSNIKVEFKCKNHGKFEVIPYKLFKNKLHICVKCRKDQINIRVHDITSFILKSKIIHGGTYNYDKYKYINNGTASNILCNEHGIFQLSPDEHLSSNRGCPKCPTRHQLKEDEVIMRFNKIHNNKYKYPNFKYNTVYEHIDIECEKHGVFKQKIMIHLNGHGCYECGKDIIRKSPQSFIERSKIIHNNKYDYSITKYRHSQEKVEIICPEHGVFSQIARDHLHGNGCWGCSINNRNFTSSYEDDIFNFIKELNPKIEIIRNYSLNRKEIDLYLPELNLGIEINGTYWHSNLYKSKEYHKIKSDFYSKRGIKIFHIWEYNLLNKNNIIKSMIKNKMLLTDNRIFARKCIIKEIDSKLYRNFCNINHIQGFSPSKIKLGLYYNNSLVACIGLGNLRNNLGSKNRDGNEYELIRYCTLLNNNIIGGASKLLKYFENNYKPNKIISYSDNDYSNGNLYIQLGFKNLGFTNISYVYFNPKTNEISNRYKYRKSELIKMGYKPSKTETQITKEIGLYSLHNSGIYKFEKIYN